jgi:ribosome biogenesis GTPase A
MAPSMVRLGCCILGSLVMFLGSLSVPSVTSFVVRSFSVRSSRASVSTLKRFYSSGNGQKPRGINHSSAGNKQKIQIPTWVPDVDDESGYSRPVIQWYPGHIAKAERLLKETFQAVDVVVEVRDARASKATSHPKVAEWCSGKPRLVVFTHVDAVPTTTFRAWKQYYEEQRQQALTETSGANRDPEQFLWVNAKQGQGIPALHRAIFKAGAHVQERRQRRGLKDRPLRVGCIGFPNVGKSALINRLLGRRRARTANTPGVTRSLQWIRVRTDDSKKTNKKEYELLDSPGIIPASLSDQSDALLLASCNCIGEASYDNQVSKR